MSAQDERLVPRKQAELAPEEVDAIAADVNRDIAAGNGLKHFEDVLDELNSTQARGTGGPDAAERDEFERRERHIMADLKRQATNELLGHGMRVTDIGKTGHGTGWLARIKDREGRQFDATITYDEMNSIDAALNAHATFRKIVDRLVKGALDARNHYYTRALIMQPDQAGGE